MALILGFLVRRSSLRSISLQKCFLGDNELQAFVVGTDVSAIPVEEELSVESGKILALQWLTESHVSMCQQAYSFANEARVQVRQ